MPRLTTLPRVALIALTSAVLLAATGVIVWRVLRPAEVVTPATAAFPVDKDPKPGAVGTLMSAPLILDGRIRIFAKKREVWSDGPAGYHYERSAYWAYRRWPAQVTGVALVRAEPQVVVTAWADGMLVGIDARSGKVVWRTEGDPLASSYEGRRTGAGTVYSPPGLLISGPYVVTHADHLRAYDGISGDELWHIPSPVSPECRGTAFTTVAAQFFVLDTCAQRLHSIEIVSGESLAPIPAAAVEPLSCAVGNSHCRAMRVSHAGSTTGWLLDGSDPAPAPALAAAGALPAGPNAVVPTAMEVTAVGLHTGQPVWTWRPQSPGPFRLLDANATRTLVLESDGTLAAINSSTGKLLMRTSILMDHEPERPYDVNSWYVSGAYLVLERTNPGTEAGEKDDAYYFTHRPVLLAYSGLAE